MINRIKQLILVVSFVSITICLLFIAQQFIKEVDSQSLKVVGSIFWIIFSGLNGYSHGKMIDRLN